MTFVKVKQVKILDKRGRLQKKTRDQTKIKLDQLKGNLKKLTEDEKTAGRELAEAQNKSIEANAVLADAEGKLQNFASGIMQEARKILEIHRRAISALKEAHASSSKPKRFREPGLKSLTNIPISGDLPKIKH